MSVRIPRHLIFCAGLLAMPQASAAADMRRPASQLSAEVQPASAVLDAFHRALGRGDRVQVLALLADEATIYESGHAERKGEYAAHHLAADIAYAKAVPATVTSRTGGTSGPLAWITTEGRTTGNYQGKAVDRRTVESAILRKQAGSWKIVHLHWSSAAVK